ncbi:histidine phosphatase family protein [Flavobacteriaceae bacterium SZ-1-7]|uniref:SixA phosphatase family protein n=1 Tax=Tamlana sedimenti TaxID=3134126 RepID=UPI0031255EC2
MKKLILVRHAKSSWEHNVIDHERPLKERGYEDANLVSNYLVEKNIKVDQVFSSDATRAKTTANIFIDNLKIDKSIVHLVHELYDFSGQNVIDVIKSADNTINTLMVFGHNHAITAVANTFGNEYVANVPTSGVVILEFDIDNWADLKTGKTLMLLFPRDLK